MINNGKIKKKLFEDDEIIEEKTPMKPIMKNHDEEMDETQRSFDEFGLNNEIVLALRGMGYQYATKIQEESLKKSLVDGDMLCLSETGSGKTLSFILPIIQFIQENYVNKGLKVPEGLSLIIAPTRQLCLQINEYFTQFFAQGLNGFRSTVLYGGVDTMKQVLQLTKKPSIIVGTPGRVLHHIQHTKGFHFRNLKYLVLDEADKLLNMDFEKQLNQIITHLPENRNAYLYSATMTSKVEKLQRVSLKNPTQLQLNPKYQTVSKLSEYYIFIPSKWKDSYLVYLLTKYPREKTIIFAKTCLGAQRLFLVLKELGFKVDCIHGQLSQSQRQYALGTFKSQKCEILVCTDLASRGIDISNVKVVINFDICPPKDYVHRVGRTARIGRQGIAISIVTQYDVQMFQNIEKKLEKQIPELQTVQSDALIFLEKLELCHQQVSKKMKKRNIRYS